MNQIFVLFCAVLSVCSFANVDAKLRIDIYYESLCPDSMGFIQNQLDPNYDSIKNDVEIYFVPFGKASSHNGGASFTCQHGPEECEINMIQSCALDVILQDIHSQDAQVEYVTCQMGLYPDPTGQSCAARVGADFSKIQQCTRSDWGRTLQLNAESYTNKVSPQFIPTIVYNGVFNQLLQDASLRNFYGVVQSLL